MRNMKKRIIAGIAALVMACSMTALTVGASGLNEKPDLQLWEVRGAYIYLYNVVDRVYETGVTWYYDDIYYFDRYGRMQTSCWGTDADGNRYFFGHDGKALLNGIFEIAGKRYCFDTMGVMQTGLVKFNDNYYYFNKKTGKQVTGFVQMGSSTYYFDTETGRMTSGWVKVKGKSYYFLNDGKMLKDCTKVINGITYMFDSDGVASELEE